MSGVYVVLEDRGGRISRISWEALAAANILAAQSGSKANAIVIGAQTEPLAQESASKAVAKVARIEHPLLAQYTSDGFRAALEQFIRARVASLPRLPSLLPGSRLRTGSGCTPRPRPHRRRNRNRRWPRLHPPLMQGRLSGSYSSSGSGPCLVSVQSGAFRADAAETSPAEIATFTPTIDASQIRTKPGEPFRGTAQTVDLGSAQLIVAVGRGIKEADNLPLVQDLASALGAEIAASRPICDNGWLPIERQVGSSGQTVTPKLYLAVGISGAIQHLVGMKGSQCIVAINKDAEAPIFEVADYGIVGDLFEVVPALTEAIKSARQ